MKSKILRILLSLFSIIFLLYPASYSISNLRILCFSILLISGIYILIKKINFKIPEKYYFVIILVLAVLTRIGIVLILNKDIIQVSDFATSLNSSFDLDFQSEYYRVFTHWIMYPTIINFIYKIFGEYQMVAYLTNAIILIIVAIMIYKIASLIFKEKKYGFYASMLYILWPANILYTLIFTQEHLCALLLLLVAYLFIKVTNSNYSKIVNYIFLISIGILLAISTFLKNFAPVFILAFIIFLGLYILKNKCSIKDILKKFIYISVIVVSFSLSKNIIFNYLDKLVKEDVARNIIPCYLNVGLRDFGTYSAENYNMYFESLRNNNYDFDKTNKEISKNLLNHWIYEKNIKDFVNLLDNKAKIIYENDNAKLSWVNSSLKNSGETIPEIMFVINSLYFWSLCILMILGLINLIRTQNLKLFLGYVIFLGSMLLLLLVEAQNRYMYSIQTLVCILAVAGIIEFDKIFKRGQKYEKIFRVNKSKTLG